MSAARTVPAEFSLYEDVAEGIAWLTRPGDPTAPEFGSGAAEGYVIALLERFEERHPEAAKEFAIIANQAKWTVGWKSFGRSALEQLG